MINKKNSSIKPKQISYKFLGIIWLILSLPVCSYTIMISGFYIAETFSGKTPLLNLLMILFFSSPVFFIIGIIACFFAKKEHKNLYCWLPIIPILILSIFLILVRS